MTFKIQIDQRFCGPPDSGNGGYSCGIIANHIGRSAKVRLLSPPPLNQNLTLLRSEGEGGRVELTSCDTVIGFGSAHDLDLPVPPAPSFDQATNAQARYVGLNQHFFPCCFVCGPARDSGDGLRIFPGPVDQDDWDLLACTWQPSADLLDDAGLVREEFVWSALDCPSYFAVVADRFFPALLGEFELKIVSDVPGNEPLIIWCWPISREGRKLYGGAALATAQGQLLAYARGAWIEVAPR